MSKSKRLTNSDRVKRTTANRFESLAGVLCGLFSFPVFGMWWVFATDPTTRDVYPLLSQVVDFLFYWVLPFVSLGGIYLFVRADLIKREVAFLDLVRSWFARPGVMLIRIIGVVVGTVILLLLAFAWDSIEIVLRSMF